MKTLTTIMLLVATWTAALAGGAVESDAAWLKKKYTQLAAVKSVTNMTNVGIWTSGNKHTDGTYGYFPKGNGLIVFEDKTWVLLVGHSMHAEDGLGDLTIIRTSDGRYLVNNGHACDKLILNAPEKITSLNTFLKATGMGANGEATQWEPYTGEPQGSGYSQPATRSSDPTH